MGQLRLLRPQPQAGGVSDSDDIDDDDDDGIATAVAALRTCVGESPFVRCARAQTPMSLYAQ
jgi:hypothetical protein